MSAADQPKRVFVKWENEPMTKIYRSYEEWIADPGPDWLDERMDWAETVINTLTEDYVKALDILGWKIVCKDDPDRRWPFDRKKSDTSVPDWCEDM